MEYEKTSENENTVESLNGDELIDCVQSGVTKTHTPNDLRDKILDDIEIGSGTIKRDVQNDTLTITGDDNAGFAGDIILYGRSAAGDNYVEIKFGSSIAIAIDRNGNIIAPNLPDADPMVAGAWWNDGDMMGISTG